MCSSAECTWLSGRGSKAEELLTTDVATDKDDMLKNWCSSSN